MSWWSRFCVSATKGWGTRMQGAVMNRQELGEQRGQREAEQLRVEEKPLCRWTAVPPSHLSGSPENTSAFFRLNTLVLMMIIITTISIATYLFDKGEHTVLYKIKNIHIKTFLKKISQNCIPTTPPPPPPKIHTWHTEGMWWREGGVIIKRIWIASIFHSRQKPSVLFTITLTNSHNHMLTQTTNLWSGGWQGINMTWPFHRNKKGVGGGVRVGDKTLDWHDLFHINKNIWLGRGLTRH